MEKTMTKEEIIFKLYFKLEKNGEMYEFLRQWSKVVKRSFNTLKNHWVAAREIPQGISEESKDWAIKYLEAKIANQ